MAIINVLQLSDLHLHAGNMEDAKVVIEALISDIKAFIEAEKIKVDFVIFNGDLVNAGEAIDDFISAQTEFIEKVLKASQVASDRLFIVPGNHDISRSTVRSAKYIDTGLASELISVDALNKFIDEQNNDGRHDAAFARQKIYFEFEKSILTAKAITSNKFVKTFSVKLDDATVGIACFNTSWRATGEADNADRRRLLFGERNIDVAAKDLSDCDIKFAVYHHPLDWMCEFDDAAVASRLFAEFDVSMTGHIHRQMPEHRISPQGNAVFCQTGCVFQRRDYFNGYQFVQVDSELSAAKISIRSYSNHPRRAFDKALNVSPNGEIQIAFKKKVPGRELNDVAEFLVDIRSVIRSNAAEHMNITETAKSLRFDAKQSFVCPPLSVKKSKATDPSRSTQSDINIRDVLVTQQNYVFVGRREAGKTSLAHHCAILAAEGCIDQSRIPIIVDYRKFVPRNSSLRKAIASYCSTSKRGLNFEKWLDNGNFLFLIDNFDATDPKKVKDFVSFVEKRNKNRWICFYDSQFEANSYGLDAVSSLKDFEPVYIKPLPRKLIRELSYRWCEFTGSDKQKTYEAVVQQLKRSNLPRSGYIVTLLLWALYQEKKFEKVNEAVLLMNVSDYLLGKADFTKALRREFDATSKEIVLQNLSNFLRQRNGFASGNATMQYLLDLFRQKGLPHDAGEVLNKLVECGIIVKVDGEISFKYRAFQDYFTALHLRDNPEIVDQVLSDYDYLNFHREIDLLSSLRRQNSSILVQLQSKLAFWAPPECADIGFKHFQELADEQSQVSVPRTRVEAIKKKKLTTEQIDDIIDAADKRMLSTESEEDEERTDVSDTDAEKEQNIEAAMSKVVNHSDVSKKMNPGMYLASVDLLGRVIRNSEFTDAEEKIAAIRQFLLHTTKVTIKWSRVLNDIIEIAANRVFDGSKLMDETEEAVARYYMNKFAIVAALDMAGEQLGTEKLSTIYRTMLDGNDTRFSERVFVSSILLDINDPDWATRWKQLVGANKSSRIILECLLDKLWFHIHRRPITEHERDVLISVAEDIERHLGTSKSQKALVGQAIRRTIADESREERGKDAR
ncbi:metallophosphoesterase [Methylobacterium fujisawaense]|uniref:metallophosphoesterase n=1 Tax=Methylobacterium fujisawaense TaxID=107400 RepID=UPI003CF1D99B